MYKNYHNTKFSNYLKEYIDVKIITLIENINKSNCKTFSCCEGGVDEEFEYSPGYIILEKENFNNIKHLLPKITHIEIGDGGYILEEFYNGVIPPIDELLYIEFCLDN